MRQEFEVTCGTRKSCLHVHRAVEPLLPADFIVSRGGAISRPQRASAVRHRLSEDLDQRLYDHNEHGLLTQEWGYHLTVSMKIVM